MKSLFSSRLFRRQFLSFAVLTIVFWGAMVAGILFRAQASIEAREEEIAGIYRDSLFKSLSLWLEERRSDIAYLAESLEADGPGALTSSSLKDRLGLLAANKSAFSDIFIIDMNGYVMENKAGAAGRRVYLGDRDYFLASKAGQPYVSGVFRNRLTGRYAFAISRPIRFDGRVAYVVCGTVLLVELADLVEGLSVQDLGSVYIIDAESRPVMGSRASSQPQAEEEAAGASVLDTLAARKAAAREEGAEKYLNEYGESVLGAYGWFPDLSLGVIVELRNDRALLPVTRLLEFSTVFSLGMLVVLLVLSYFQSASLLRPIQALAQGAETLAARGYADIELEKTNTELDSLIEAFNSMSRRVRERETELRDSAARDSLTGLYNHAKIEEYLDFEIKRGKRGNGSVCFVMLDIDHFKDINDRYGHQAGDFILRELAQILLRSCREGDLIGRYGGEEFSIILNATNAEETAGYCERMRKIVETHEFIYEGISLKTTVSLGYTCLLSTAMVAYDVVKSADRALYQAKERGRNKVVAG